MTLSSNPSQTQVVKAVKNLETNVSTYTEQCYTNCDSKGATIPSSQTLANLPATINTIPTGGSATVGDYDVVFFDFKGEFEKRTADENDTITFPTPRTISGMTFANVWTSQVPITGNTLTMPNFSINVSPLYYTTSGKTEIDIDITTSEQLTQTFIFDKIDIGTMVVEWGDLASDTDSTNTGKITFTHTYSSIGKYTILLNCTVSHYLGGASGLAGQSYSAKNLTIRSIRCSQYVTGINGSCFAYMSNLTEVSLAPATIKLNVALFNTALYLNNFIYPPNLSTSYNFSSNHQNNYVLTHVNIPYGASAFQSNLFFACYSLDNMPYPNSINSFGNYTFRTNYTRLKLTIKSSITKVNKGTFYGNYAMKRITFLGDLTEIQASAFQQCYSCKVYDLTHCTAVTTLANVSAFTDTNPDKQIVVPDALYSDWIIASNWSTFSGFIISKTNFLAGGGTLE